MAWQTRETRESELANVCSTGTKRSSVEHENAVLRRAWNEIDKWMKWTNSITYVTRGKQVWTWTKMERWEWRVFREVICMSGMKSTEQFTRWGIWRLWQWKSSEQRSFPVEHGNFLKKLSHNACAFFFASRHAWLSSWCSFSIKMRKMWK